MSAVLEETPSNPELAGDDHVAHYADKNDILRGAIDGVAIRALCGATFVPHRDPSRFPICPSCDEFMHMLRDLRPGGEPS